MEQDPKDLYKSGISDHAPVAVSIINKAPLPRGEGAIAPEITTHPLYPHFLQLLVWDEKYNDLKFANSFEELQFLKNLMNAAACFVRDFLQTHNNDLPIIRTQSLSSISRAVWTQSIPLAETLLKYCDLAREHILIQENRVLMKDPVAFAAAADSANTVLYQNRANDLRATPSHSNKDNQIQKHIKLGETVDSPLQVFYSWGSQGRRQHHQT